MERPVVTSRPISRQAESLLSGMGPLMTFLTESTWAKRAGAPGISDLVAGNPQEPPLAEFVDAIRRWSVPQDNSWFAYKPIWPKAQAAAAASLRSRRGIPFRDEDVLLTNGAFGALATCIRAVCDPGDEVVYLSPPWFFYEPMIRFAGANPVRVDLEPPGFDLDARAVAAALTPRTRAIIVNSPHNPSGRIYQPDVLERLAAVLTEASERNGRPIYLLSDEAYFRIVYDGVECPSPAAFYPYSFLIYTWAKTLLTPGERLGYIVLSPLMPDAEAVRGGLFMSQVIGGYLFPNVVMQYALGELEELSIDVAHLQRKRDRMVEALREAGYELGVPDGTFYLLPRSPLADDWAFVDLLAERDVFILPGAVVELPGYFRISLTASDEMLDRAIPVFASIMREIREATETAASRP
jgi:aspartate aminotransferase